MDKNRNNLDTSGVDTGAISFTIDNLMRVSKNQRRSFERRWYDNNFFDDGFHFRFLSRQTNKIVDLSERSTIYSPTRVIPKASRQIRGVANLLLFNDPTPSVYPENISQSDYSNPEEYQKAVENAKHYALRTGHWLTEEWKNQEMMDKMALMVILALKHGVSYLQVWPDAVDEAIRTQVYDAFDIYLMGNLTSIYDSPYMIKAVPMLISQIKANENFNKDQLNKISPDNKYASSEIKDAYLMARYGRETQADESATLILKEAFLKEYVNEINMAKIRAQEDGDKILKGKKIGDPIIRQVFSAGGVWLRDVYTQLPDYPFVDFRMEPGNIYQVPMIERFISANKSLDQVVSRVERYTHTMASGKWLKRQGEQFKISNQSGGEVIEYQGTPPEQMQIAPLPQFLFEFMSVLTGYIEEQGVSTTALSKIPAGVKSNAAIESLKESELANLVMSNRQLKKTIKNICEKFLDIVDSYFLTPQTVMYLEKGQPDYFDIIGGSALKSRKQLKVGTPENVIPVKKEYRVEVEIEAGLGYTKEGQKDSMQKFADYMLQLAQAKLISPDAMKYVVEKLVEVFQFGKSQELLEGLDTAKMTAEMSDDQLTQMKMAVLSALKDAGEVGPEASQKRMMENKVGVLEALKESGLSDKIKGPVVDNPELAPIPYKDAPEDIKRQMEANAGLQPSEGISPTGSDQLAKHHTMVAGVEQQQMQQDQADKKYQLEQAKLAQQDQQAQSQQELAQQQMATQQPKGEQA
jgi:hypothetical protein